MSTTTTMTGSTSTAASYLNTGKITNSIMPDLSVEYSRVVRFDNECVLIPDANFNRSKRVVLTKSYSLPLWRRKTSNSHSMNSGESDLEEGPSSIVQTTSLTQDERVVIKVPIPTFRTKSARSPSRGRSASSSPPSVPLSPCLVHRTPSTSPNNPRISPVRRTSLPTYQNPKHDPTARKVPLRACCLDCERITEESLKEGDEWKEHFSKGARRRRSSSASSDGMGMGAPYAAVMPASSFVGVTRPGSPLIGGSSLGRISPTRPSTFSLTVDEVDKRRKSQEYIRDDDIGSPTDPESIRMKTHSPASPLASPVLFQHASSSSSPTATAGKKYSYPYTYRHTTRSGALPSSASSSSPSSSPHERDISSGSTTSATSSNASASGSPEVSQEMIIANNTRRMRSSPIEEEDEAQLFPLPSPRRSPNNSPTPSASPRASPRASPGVSPTQSPSNSTSCLAVPGSASRSASSSRESVRSHGSRGSNSTTKSGGSSKGSSKKGSEEGVLKGNITRKLVSGIGVNGLLDPSAAGLIPDVDLTAPTPTPSRVDVPFPLDIDLKEKDRHPSSPVSPKGPRPPVVLSLAIPSTSTSTSGSGFASTSFSKHVRTSSAPLASTSSTTRSTSSNVKQLPAIPSSSLSSALSSSPPPVADEKHGPFGLHNFHTHTRTPSLTSGKPTSPPVSMSPPSSPTVGGSSHSPTVGKRKHSFTLPTSLVKAGGALRDVGVDVLKGVSSMGGGGVVNG